EREWVRFWFADQPSHLSCERIQGGIDADTGTATKSSLEERLRLPVSLNYKDVPLAQVLNDLRQWQGLNIVLDKKALEEAGISPDLKINIQLENVALKSALNITLRIADLVCKIQDNVILVTTPRAAQGAVICKTYDIAEIVRAGKFHWKHKEGSQHDGE